MTKGRSRPAFSVFMLQRFRLQRHPFSPTALLGVWSFDHAQCGEVGVEDGFLFGALVLVLLADGNDLFQDLRVEAYSPLS
ncbi:hypothetical protein ASE23_12970 [Rhizobium sp. Root73]|nr:hypothetical protein ASD36_15170 [Rhizobium sp. Root1334]KRC00343.1 hypothetical protein ASE23_12970 [Rhizobium sp. Root73]